MLGGRDFETPEEASSEVLKALMAQAKMDAGEFDVEGAVVTIPAAFNQMQTEATSDVECSASQVIDQKLTTFIVRFGRRY